VAETIRYGIIGSGMMGIEHMLNIRIIPDAEVVAVADPDETSRGWARDTAPAATIFNDTRELLDRAEVDALVIATPNFTHADVLDGIWSSGLHLMVEKPLATTLADCRRVQEAAADHTGLVWVGMEYRYMPLVARFIDEVRAKSAGTLKMLAIREHRYPFLKKVGDWNRFSANTGGTLVEKCCHFFDLMNHIIGARPVRVFASGAQDVNHLDERYEGRTPDILDNAFTLVDYEGGCRAMLDLCMFAEGSRSEQEISAVGSEGKIECLLPQSTLVIGRRDPKKVDEVHVELDESVKQAGFHHGATYFEHLAFLDAIRRGTPPAVDVDDGLRAVALGVAAQTSIEQNRPVEMSEFGL
jgi:predicted dehydrogenase